MLPLAMTSGSNPILSIITPILHARHTLQETLQSLAPLSTLNFPFEHIVVDASALEHDPVFLQNNHWPFRRLYQPPEGVYSAFELGRNQAQGEFLWFLNAGDLLKDVGLFIQMLEAIQRSSSTDAVIAGVEYFRDQHYLFSRSPGRDVGKQISRGFIPCHQAMLYRKSVFDHVGGFRTDLKIASDVDHHLRLVEAGRKLISFRKPLIQYDVGGLSGTSARFMELSQIAKDKSWPLRARYTFNHARNRFSARVSSPLLRKAWYLARRGMEPIGQI